MTDKAHGDSEAIYYALAQTCSFIDHIIETDTPDGEVCRVCYITSLIGTLASTLVMVDGVDLSDIQEVIADATEERREAVAQTETGIRMQ